mmetsp:Transcript_15670/g.42300  ORF Transcript_15670/g.42300 Transcript_15670/m.42300 type:complete len:233 (-) Transcript_15670:724-1422(-)
MRLASSSATRPELAIPTLGVHALCRVAPLHRARASRAFRQGLVGLHLRRRLNVQHIWLAQELAANAFVPDEEHLGENLLLKPPHDQGVIPLQPGLGRVTQAILAVAHGLHAPRHRSGGPERRYEPLEAESFRHLDPRSELRLVLRLVPPGTANGCLRQQSHRGDFGELLEASLGVEVLSDFGPEDGAIRLDVTLRRRHRELFNRVQVQLLRGRFQKVVHADLNVRRGVIDQE